MTLPQTKKRKLHILPGRIRMDIHGLQGNKRMAELLLHQFLQCPGVKAVQASILSGRLLILFDEVYASLEDMITMAQSIEKGIEISTTLTPMIEEVAASVESNETLTSQAGVPLPLTLTVAGLTVLTAKQLFFGKSVLAKSPMSFYLSGLLSVCTGYPLLKRGIHQFSQSRKLNADLLLGASALALALVRENVVALAGLSLLYYVNWQRQRIQINAPSTQALSPEIQAYSERIGKWGLLAAAGVWAITRNPMRGLAVLLAANPRIITLPSEFAWNQAELIANDQHYTLPIHGSLAQLAANQTLLIEDTSLLFKGNTEEIVCVSHQEDFENKLICMAASLMEKSKHPWRDEVWNKAKSTCLTLRSTFHLEEEKNGMQGKINNSYVYMGNTGYLQQNGINCDKYILEERRLRKNGFHVLLVAKQTNKIKQCVGMLIKKQQLSTAYGHALQQFTAKGWRLGFLKDSINISHLLDPHINIDLSWLKLESDEIVERMAAMRQTNETIMLMTSTAANDDHEHFSAIGIPSFQIDQLNEILETSDYTSKINHAIHQQFKLAKKWNLFSSIFAAFGMISAPIINIAADALTLVFMSKSKNISESLLPQLPDHLQQQAMLVPFQEIAAASETVSWHALPADQVLQQYQVTIQKGLSSIEAAQLKQVFGLNQLETKKQTPFLLSYLAQFKEFTTLILLGTSILAFFTGGIFDGAAMGTILLANAAIGTIQERKAEKAVDALNQFQPLICKTLREGQLIELHAAELVPGDIVHLEAGDRIPADIRILQALNLQMNESALTGESLPIEKNELPIADDEPLTERTNMLYMGTDVSRGKAVGIVVQTGMNSEMGHLVALLKKDDKEITPLQQKVTTISKTFVKGALAAGGLIFLAGLLRGIPVSQMLTTSITLAASAIPEGLPVTITIALSAGILRLAKKKALIRKLSTLETLGRTTILCTDKTGTLTKNEMTVQTIATMDHLWTVSGNGYEPVGAINEISPPEEVAVAAVTISEKDRARNSTSQPDLQRLLQIGLLCNNSKLYEQDGHWMVKGDPTEGALITLAAKGNLQLKQMQHWHRGIEVPFDSNTGKMSVVCRDSGTQKDCYVFSKGALETILRFCRWYQTDGEIKPLTEEQKGMILQQNEKLAGDALRVLGFAYRPIPEHEHEVGMDEKEMIYVGMVGMIDPPKVDVEASIREAYELGIKPVMITGDHPITAIAIARQLNIYDGSQKVLSGHELTRLTDDELIDMVDDISVFARVTPDQKLRIISAFQKRGHIVAMTGDGVNDTPAIKQADIGIAMGLTGTEVTKQTAVMVLKEDELSSVVDGVKEGRTIICNIRKALGCLLTGNLAEILVTSAAVLIGLPIPFVPIQILLMNMLTDALPAMILAVNPGNKTKQTKRMEIVDKELYHKVVSKGALLGLGSVVLYAASLASGVPIAVAQSVAFATLVTGQLIQTFSWRQEGSDETIRDWTQDRFLIGSLGVSCIALLSALYVPAIAGFFHTAPIALKYWIPILAVASSISFLSKALLSLISKGSHAPFEPQMNTMTLGG